jgi:hypothetical protein
MIRGGSRQPIMTTIFETERHLLAPFLRQILGQVAINKISTVVFVFLFFETKNWAPKSDVNLQLSARSTGMNFDRSAFTVICFLGDAWENPNKNLIV